MPPSVNTSLLAGRKTSSLIKREDLDTRTSGHAVVANVRGDNVGIIATFTGVDNGTGDVVMSLKPVDGLVPGIYNKFRTDSTGRIVQAWLEDYSTTGGGSTSQAVFNQFSAAQLASFWIAGSARVDGITTLKDVNVTGALQVETITFTQPIGTESGGTGVTVASQGTFLSGPASGNPAAPTFRSIIETDLPSIGFSKIHGLPNTLVGYGITDAYNKTESDLRYIPTSHLGAPNGVCVLDSNGKIPTTAMQTVTVNGDVTGSGTNNIVLSLAATGVAAGNYGDNLHTLAITVDEKGRIVNIASVPIASASFRQDNFSVANVSDKTYNLTYQPINNSMSVFLNGLRQLDGLSNDFTLVGSQLIFNNTVSLSVGDSIAVVYSY